MSKKYTQLARILKKLLFERNMRPIDLAREANIPPPTIHRLITGKSTRPYKSSLKPIADYFAISIEQLIGENPVSSNSSGHASIFSNNQITKVPIISWKEVTDFPQSKSQFEHEIAISGNINKNAFALIMSDSSMEPLFPFGTILIFNPDIKVKDRAYALVKISDKEMPVFRQVLIDLEHKFIKPLNPDLSSIGMRLLTKNDKIIACLYESRFNHEILEHEDLLKALIYAE